MHIHVEKSAAVFGRREGEEHARYMQRGDIERNFELLLEEAMAAGFKVTIHNQPLQPLAMRNDLPIIAVYDSRK